VSLTDASHLLAARVKVDELTAEGKVKDEEIERLKKLLAQRGDAPDNSAEIAQLKSRVTQLEGTNSTKTIRITELESQLRDAQRAPAPSPRTPMGNDDALQKQIQSMREQLQSQSKLFSDQMDNTRKREESLRADMVKSRQEHQAELAKLRAELARALENENAYKVEQLNRQMVRLRRECALRLTNGFLFRLRAIMATCMFHHWGLVTYEANAERKLSAEARFRLEQARAKADGLSLFGNTPLLHKTHMQTRDVDNDKHRFELWENMAPRGGRGDGRISQVRNLKNLNPNPDALVAL